MWSNRPFDRIEMRPPGHGGGMSSKDRRKSKAPPTPNAFFDCIAKSVMNAQGAISMCVERMDLNQEVRQLTPEEIGERIIGPNCASSFDFAKNGFRLRYAWLSFRGYYPQEEKPNQDSFICLPHFGSCAEKLLLGVFDGHGSDGDRVAQFTRDEIAETLAKLSARYAHDFEQARVAVCLDNWHCARLEADADFCSRAFTTRRPTRCASCRSISGCTSTQTSTTRSRAPRRARSFSVCTHALDTPRATSAAAPMRVLHGPPLACSCLVGTRQ